MTHRNICASAATSRALQAGCLASALLAIAAGISPVAGQDLTISDAQTTPGDALFDPVGDVIIESTGSFNFNNPNGTTVTFTPGGGDFTNAGTITDSGAGTVVINGTISNQGTIDKNAGSGTLTLNGNLTNSGTITVAAGSGTLSLTGNITNTGTIDLSGSTSVTGTITNNGAAAQAEIDGTTSVSGGITNTLGTLVVGSGGNLTANVSNSDTTEIDGTLTGNLTNAGGTTTIGGDVTGTASVTGGTVDIGSAGDIDGLTTIGASGTVTNSGTLDDVSNAGAFTNNSGADAGDVTNAGAGTGSNAGTLASLTHNSTGTFTNGGDVVGNLSQSAGTVTNSGSVGGAASITGGTLNIGFTGDVTGTTTIGSAATVSNSGTLAAVSNSGTFINNASGEAGALTNSGAGTGSNAGTLASLTHNSTGTFTNSGDVTGNLSQSAGTVANNGSVGGAASITGGTLNVGSMGDVTGTTTISSGATVANSGTLVAVSNSGTFTNNASGEAGALTNSGAGTGSNAGTLASLTHNSTGTFTSSGDVTGNLSISGGTVTLTNTGTIGGITSATGGRVLVNGTAEAVAISNAIFGGSGTVGATTINAGGILAPGNSIGTLTVTNGLILGAGSTYAVEVNGNGTVAGVNNDLTQVTGALTIGVGAKVQVRAENGTDTGQTYAPSSQYTIITHTGARTGEFDEMVDEDFAFLDASLLYDANAVSLLLFRNDLSIGSVAMTPNQQGPADVLDAIGSSDPVYQAMLGLSSEQAAAALNSISGELHASGQHVANQSFGMFQWLMGMGPSNGRDGKPGNIGFGHSSDLLAYGAEPGVSAGLVAIDALEEDSQSGHAAWLSALGGAGTIAADGNASDMDWSALGLAGGYEGRGYFGGGEATAGISAGYVRGEGAIADLSSNLTSDGYFLGTSAGWDDGALSLRGGLAYGAIQMQTVRDVAVGGITREAKATYWNQNLGLGLEAAYAYQLSPELSLGPVAAVNVGWSGHGEATETGAGSLDASLDPTSDWSLDTALGIELTHATVLADGAALELRTRVLWEHSFGDTSPEQSMTLAGGGPAYTVSGADLGRDRVRFGAGLSLAPDAATTLSLDYLGSFSNLEMSHSGAASLTFSF